MALHVNFPFRSFHFRQLIPLLGWGRDDLSDLTPDIITILGWLGVKDKETICGAFHDVFINSIEKVLKLLVVYSPKRKGGEGIRGREGERLMIGM